MGSISILPNKSSRNIFGGFQGRKLKRVDEKERFYFVFLSTRRPCRPVDSS